MSADTGEVPVHTRTLEMNSYADSGSSIRMVARLRDRRPWQPDPTLTVLHDMTITLVVELDSMTITAATSDMQAFPHAECPLVVSRFGRLVGLNVQRGYSSSLRAAFGGVTGCSHLHELARAAGSAVVQSRMSTAARERVRAGATTGEPATLDAVAGMCHVWAADGPGPAKLDAGWRPGTTRFPVPPVGFFTASHGALGRPAEEGSDGTG